MIDIQSYFMSLKASWVSRLVSNQLVNWKVIPCKYFAKLGKKWLVFSQNLDNITVNKYAKQIPEFYGEVLRSWNKIGIFCFNYIYPSFGIAFFMMVNSVIQLDLLFKWFKIKLCDISPFSSKISFT
jgi:hypothetical protein